MSVILTAAAALDSVTRVPGYKNVVEAAAAAEARGLREQSPIYLPYLSGERTPHNDAHARGVFFGLTAETTSADLVHAVLEGVRIHLCRWVGRTQGKSGGEIGNISVTGGGARLPYWGRILASALDLP